MKKIVVNTLCRSGNHAIIFWLLDNLGGITEHHDGYTYWNRDAKIYFYNNCNHIQYQGFPHDYAALIKSYEDDLVAEQADSNIIILRDFVNLVASRFRKYRPKLGLNWSYIRAVRPLIDMWKKHANSILSDGDVVGILYNRWISDKEYRDKTSERLGIKNTLDKIDHVSNIGEGSSFIGVKMEDDKTKYLERYKSVDLPEGVIKEIKSDVELVELNKILFNIDILEIF